MKTRTRSLILALVVLMALVAPHAAAEGEVTVQGEVLDMACYLGHGAKGDEHAACAAKSIKAGQPMGLLASDGKVYLLVASHKDGTAFDAVSGQEWVFEVARFVREVETWRGSSRSRAAPSEPQPALQASGGSC